MVYCHCVIVFLKRLFTSSWIEVKVITLARSCAKLNHYWVRNKLVGWAKLDIAGEILEHCWNQMSGVLWTSMGPGFQCWTRTFSRSKERAVRFRHLSNLSHLSLRTVLQRRDLTCLKILIPNPHSATCLTDLIPRSFACLHSLLSECKYVEEVYVTFPGISVL